MLGKSYIVPLRVGIDKPAKVTPAMLKALRLMQHGILFKPEYRHKHWEGWNEACKLGFVGEVAGERQILTKIGRLALAQVEQQIVVMPEQCLMQMYSFAR